MRIARLRVITTALLGLALAAPLAAQTHAPGPPGGGPPPSFRDSRELPATPAYRRAREVLALVNAGDPARVQAYVDSAFAPAFRTDVPLADHLDAFAEAHDRSGRLEEHGARTYTPPRPPNQAVLVVWNPRMETWEAITTEVEPAAPYRLTSLAFNGARTPSDVPPAPALTDAEIVKRLDALVSRLAAADRFSGTVLFAKDGKVLYSKAVGVANRDFDAPVTLDTKFNLGSMNKMFTAVAVMQLVEQGKVSLDDPIGRWLDESWLPRPILEKVKVKHLLTHTSGLGSYFNDVFERTSREHFRVVDDYRPLVQGDTLRFEPGTRYAYSNTGMLLAGAIVQKASGQDYFDYVREHVSRPAGMASTDCYALDQVNRNLAVGYERRLVDGKPLYENNVFKHVMRGGPAGGGYSTVGDLLRFDRALRDGRLLKKESTDALWRAYPELGANDYGLGFGVSRGPAGRAVGHSGGFVGINSELKMFLDSGHTIVAMGNLGFGASPIVEFVTRLLAQGR
jgi:CubicO group peptidase (beta-lactamase class C family)